MKTDRELNINKIQKAHNQHREWLTEQIRKYAIAYGFNNTWKNAGSNNRTLNRILNKDNTIKFDTVYKFYKKLYTETN